MRSIEPGIHNPGPWLWIPGLRPRAHPGMTLGVFSCPYHPRHCERSEAIQLPCGCAMDCFATLAITMDARAALRCTGNDEQLASAVALRKPTAVVPHKRSAMRDP